MEYTVFYSFLLIFGVEVTCGMKATPSAGAADVDAGVIRRLEMLEQSQRESKLEIQRLQQLTVEQSDTIQELRTEAVAQKQTIASLRDQVKRNENKMMHDYEHVLRQCSDVLKLVRDSERNQTGLLTKGIRNKRQSEEKLAFTAYTDKPMTPSPTEIIKFDQVLTNIGDGYNVNSGMFTANQNGLYLFSFTVSEVAENHFIWADLLVNGVKQLETAAETFHKDQDVQGTNMAVVSLQSGDLVWVATRTATQLPGGPAYRLTTFTGAFLY